jgi:protein-tyrosine kinase
LIAQQKENMTRIHDALRKAAQEEATNPGREDSLVAAKRGATRQEGSPATDTENVFVMPGGEGKEPPTQLTYELLLARCRHPHWSPDPKTILFFSAQNHTYGTEEFRTLRSRLYQIRANQPLRTVLITSALPGEGKSFTVANLALTIARQHERRVLMVDADLRLPNLHGSLGAPLTPGLSDYLLGEADELSIIQKGSRPNLFFIPGGKPISNPAELLGNGRLKNLLRRLAPVFDWILLDSPPVVPISDACLLSELCDGVLMVVKAAATPVELAQKACREFQGKGKPLVGVVLNRVKRGASYSSYYYNHYPPAAEIGSDKS